MATRGFSVITVETLPFRRFLFSIAAYTQTLPGKPMARSCGLAVEVLGWRSGSIGYLGGQNQ